MGRGAEKRGTELSARKGLSSAGELTSDETPEVSKKNARRPPESLPLDS